eukprot:TRINITY_DN11053_c0_g1_i1.p1 TRINITY_DN11053_c0_g1~~TRINITY_DN11053_c0_g1_i1.p1  ORF type:complete len:318 (+),score=56.85 TRINITY_DN11053_c0_g1_i1:123-956(+)
MCLGVLATGIGMQLIRSFPTFQPLAMLGGVIWCTGNALSVTIIQHIGMSLGILIWGITAMSVGWLTGNFGWFGLKQNVVPSPGLNFIGFLLTVTAALIFSQVESGKEKDDEEAVGGRIEYEEKKSKYLGVVLSLVSGVAYGLNFTPAQYLIDNDLGSDNGLDYVFSHFCGIFLMSTVLLIGYSVRKGFKGVVIREIVVPGYLSGVIWGIGQICYFGANSSLSFVISFPIIQTGPGVVASLWGILVFNEIQGQRNLSIFGLGCGVGIIGIVLITLSSM